MGYTYCVPKPSTIEASSAFGQWIEQTIDSYGLNRKAFAFKSGVGTSTVTNWISGARSPKRDTIAKIAAGLESDQQRRAALLREGLAAAGFSGMNPDTDLLDTLVDRAGYDNEMLGEEDREQLARSINALIVGIVEQAKRDRRKS